MTDLDIRRPVRGPDESPYELGDRYRTGSGPMVLTGVQAIARALVEQHERDARAGVRVATFVSGYQGSPLGGVDRMLAGMPDVLRAHDITFVPGLNEELAATSVWGSQADLPNLSTDTATLRRRRGRLVRQGAGPGSRDRRAAARQHVRREPARRDAAAGRRRPGLQVLHRARRQRAIAGRARDPGALPAQRPRDRHHGHARRGDVAGIGMRRRAQDRRRRRRRRLVRRLPRRRRRHRRSRSALGRKAFRLSPAADGGSGRQPRRRGRPVRTPGRGGACLRRRQRSRRHRDRPTRTRRSGSPPPARRSTRCGRPSSTSAPTTSRCITRASGCCGSGCPPRWARAASPTSPTDSTRSSSSRTRPPSSRPRSAKSSTVQRMRRESSARRTPPDGC